MRRRRSARTIQSATEGKTRVFVSYSRKDADFAIWLQRGLAERGIVVFRDIEDTLPGEEWWRRLQELIGRADTVVFVLSPNSVDSAVCRDEVAYAQTLNKRVFPAVIADIKWASVPDGLAKIHSVFFNEIAGREAALDQLVEALETDIEWIREHTRLGELAHHWDTHGRPAADLLRRRALDEAERWLTQRPNSARSPTNLHQEYIQASRAAARRRGRIAVVASLVVAVGVSALGGFAYLQRLEAELRRLEAQRSAYLRSVENSSRLTEFAKQNIREGDPVTATLLAMEALPDREKSERPYYPPAELVLRAALRARNERLVLGGGYIVRAAVFSPDGHRILTAENDGRARIWDAVSGKVIAVLHGRHTVGARTAAYSPDGRQILIGDDNGTARVWDANTHERVREIPASNKSLRVAIFSPDGRRILTAGLDSAAALWDSATGERQSRLTGHVDAIENAAFSKDGLKVVTASLDRTATVWDAETGRRVATVTGHRDRVGTAVFSPDGERVLTASDDATARLWDAASGKELDRLLDHEAAVRFAAFSPDGRRIITTSRDKSARLWDSQIGRGGADGIRTLTLLGHRNDVRQAAFSVDGKRVVTVSDDQSARVWEVETGAQVAVLNGHQALISSAVFSADGQTVLTASEDNTARTWSVQPKPDVTVLEEDDDVVFAAFSRDGALLVTTWEDGTARIWSVAAGKARALLKGHDEQTVAADFSPDATRVVTASHDGTARIWDTVAAQEIHKLEVGNPVDGVAHDPDGRRILTASSNGSAILWDSASGKRLGEFKSPGSGLFSAAFSADGRRILTASAKCIARIWDAASGQLVSEVSGHTGACRSAAFSPDGRRVVTAGDTSARIWDSATGSLIDTIDTAKELRGDARGAGVLRAIFSRNGRSLLLIVARRPYAYLWDISNRKAQELIGHTNPVTKAAFSPNGQRIVTASYDGTVRLWDADTGGAVDELDGHHKRVTHVAFAPDGRRVATTSADQTARLWRTFASTQEVIDFAKNEIPRCLTPTQRRDKYGLDDDAPWCKRLGKWPFAQDR